MRTYSAALQHTCLRTFLGGKCQNNLWDACADAGYALCWYATAADSNSAAHCNLLKHTATCWNTLQNSAAREWVVQCTCLAACRPPTCLAPPGTTTIPHCTGVQANFNAGSPRQLSWLKARSSLKTQLKNGKCQPTIAFPSKFGYY